MSTTQNGNVADGKAPVSSEPSTTTPNPAVGFRSNNNDRTVKVQPARLEDLQPTYAQTLPVNNDNPAAHGWYASMSKFSVLQAVIRVAIANQP